MSKITCATDKIQEKTTFWATVIFLDGIQQNYPITCRLKGCSLLNQIFKDLDLIERDYFGLQIMHENTEVVWVEPDKIFQKQWSAIKCDSDDPDPTLKFRVKYYVKDPSKLYESKTRHQFYLQLKDDIYKGKLPCSVKQSIQLASYIAQIELGDYISIDHEPGYLNKLQLSRGQNEEFERRVTDMHKLHRGLAGRDAELKYLEIAKKLEMYGVHLYKVKDEACKDMQLGVTLQGLSMYNSVTNVKIFPWCQLVKASVQRKKFSVKIKEKPDDKCNKTVKFKMDTSHYAKSFWKTLTDHYNFYRREKSGATVNCPEPKQSGMDEKSLSIRDKISKTFTNSKCKRFASKTTSPNKTTKADELSEVENESVRDPFDKIFHSSLTMLCEGVTLGFLDEQFRKLPRKDQTRPITVGKTPDNIKKNYRAHILPYDHNRVVLKGCQPSGDYINASYVNMEVPCETVKRYIATQSPLTNTMADFWRMVQQENSHLIVMLTTVMENGVFKSQQYWPYLDEELELSPGFFVKCVIEQSDETGSYVFRELILIDKNKKPTERTIEHMQYLAWPNAGVPEDPKLFLQFRQRVNDIWTSIKAHECLGSEEPPIIVHCSAGISRTGVYILVDTALNLLNIYEPIYPTDILTEMRLQRSGFIQNTKLFRFTCECICVMYLKLVHDLGLT